MPQNLTFERLAELLENSPWLAQEWFGNSIGHYLGVLIVVLLVSLISRAIAWAIESHVKKLTSKTQNQVDDMFLETIHRSITYILVLAAIFFGEQSLDMPESVDEITKQVVFILFTVKITHELDRFLAFVIRDFLDPLVRRQKGFIKTFMPAILRFSKFFIWGIAILLIISNLGYNIVSILAGLGIGGLAIALAAQETLGNVFGSIAILVDQPFKIGDWVNVEGYSGTIVEVGMRSTKIKSIDKTVVSIPNNKMAAAIIENVSKQDMKNVNQVLDFNYGTSMTKMRELLKALEQLLRRDKNTDKDTIRVNFLEFGDSSLRVTVFYYVKDTVTYKEFLDVRQRINLKIKEQVEKMGIEMAFPTQSLYLRNAESLRKTATRRKTNK